MKAWLKGGIIGLISFAIWWFLKLIFFYVGGNIVSLNYLFTHIYYFMYMAESWFFFYFSKMGYHVVVYPKNWPSAYFLVQLVKFVIVFLIGSIIGGIVGKAKSKKSNLPTNQ